MKLRLTFIGLAAVPAMLSAQQLPDLRQSVDPATIRAQRESQRPRDATRPEQPSTPLPAPAPGEVSFQLREVVIEGLPSTGLEASAFEPDYAEATGKAISLGVLEAIATRMTARLRRAGAILSVATVPPQEVADGQVRIVIVQGRAATATAEGDIRGPRRLIDAPLARVAAEVPLSFPTLERNLLIIRDLPGVSAITVIEPDPAVPAAARLTAQISHRPIEAYLAVDNRGSRLSGAFNGQAGVSLNSVLGLYERIDLAAAFSLENDRLRFVQGRFALPIGTDGDRLEIAGDYTRVRPRLERVGIDGLDFIVKGWTGELAYARPLQRARSANITARAMIRLTDNRSDERFFGFELDGTRERLAVGGLALTTDFDLAGGVVFADVNLMLGLDIFGSRVEPALEGVGPQFVYATARLARLQPLGHRVSLLVEAIAQVAAEPLPTSQRFSVGGARIGRGFAPASANGDSGFGLRTEIRWTTQPVSSFRLQAYGFLDYGVAADEDAGRDGDRISKLASIGGGARLFLANNLVVAPEISHQLSGRSVDTQKTKETRLLIELQLRY